MRLDIRKAEYYNTEIDGDAGEGFRILSILAAAGVSLLAFKAVPVRPNRTRFSLFSNDGKKMTDGARKAGLTLDGPHHAILIQGDDEPGALADIYQKLSAAGIRQEESSGIANVEKRYGVVIYLTAEDCDKALAALAN